MKNLFFLLLSVVTFAGCSEPKINLRAATYNVRYDAAADATNGDSWAERKADVAKLIHDYDFDIVGTQEANDRQLPELAALLPEYDYIFHPYGNVERYGHNCITFFKRDKYELLDKGTFWYSQTPDTESVGWDANDYRLCNWGKFLDKATGREFYYFNSHLYWRLEEARANSGKVLVDKVRAIAGDAPAICVGDYNSKPETPQVSDILLLLSDAYAVSETSPAGSYDTDLGGGNFVGPANGRIDYIFVSKGIRVKDYTVPEDKRENGHYPSDHLPIVCNLEIE
ncbi:MAG: endonuclease/exonuclease/phosphatase family protein [Alistipes sp.]|nr:endonuclease/exonuclease/phosphatase family protein [Alistipes sp.]